MNTSATWINEYLDPPASAAVQAELLTRAGFPLEHAEEVILPNGTTDVRQDIELTSNRGDCLCHVGLAREVAAVSGRTWKRPTARPKASGPAADSLAKVTNKEPQLCPLYTARIIRGVKVAPSPPWLANRLLARGDIPRNNIVDLSNFVLFELGLPTHVFDLAKLHGPEIIVRRAKPNERFLPIGEGAAEVLLHDSDLVIADADRAVAIAGVKGGALTAVSQSTTDILIEAATFDPVNVRQTSRRLGIASDSSYRYERGVHAGQVNPAAERLAELVLQTCGGTLCSGVLSAGLPIPAQRTVSMRCEHCRQILGFAVSDQEMIARLARLGFEPKLISHEAAVECTIPHERIDVVSEIDLIEEVGRIIGLDQIPIAETIQVRVAPPQARELARRAVHETLVGMGYLETVTHSLISDAAATHFAVPGLDILRVTDERAAEPALRSSLLPSLLRVFALNRDRGVKDVKLFEAGATFTMAQGSPLERVNLAFLHTATSSEQGLREARGAIDRAVAVVCGKDQPVRVAAESRLPWFAAGAVVRLGDDVLGMFGVLAPEVTQAFGIAERLCAAEIGLPQYYDRYPPLAEATALPVFPAIERDLSIMVDDAVPWIDIHAAVGELQLQHVEATEFVTTFRGKQIGGGRKSLTLRVRFRATDRTLMHDQVDTQMESVMQQMRSRFNAEIRT